MCVCVYIHVRLINWLNFQWIWIGHHNFVGPDIYVARMLISDDQGCWFWKTLLSWKIKTIRLCLKNLSVEIILKSTLAFILYLNKDWLDRKKKLQQQWILVSEVILSHDMCSILVSWHGCIFIWVFAEKSSDEPTFQNQYFNDQTPEYLFWEVDQFKKGSSFLKLLEMDKRERPDNTWWT